MGMLKHPRFDHFEILGIPITEDRSVIDDALTRHADESEPFVEPSPAETPSAEPSSAASDPSHAASCEVVDDGQRVDEEEADEIDSARHSLEAIREDLLDDDCRKEVVDHLWAQARNCIDAMLVLIDGETISSDEIAKMKEVLTDLFHFDATYADRRLRSHLTSMDKAWKEE